MDFYLFIDLVITPVLTAHLHLVPRSENTWRYSSTPPIRLHGVVPGLKKHRENFT